MCNAVLVVLNFAAESKIMRLPRLDCSLHRPPSWVVVRHGNEIEYSMGQLVRGSWSNAGGTSFREKARMRFFRCTSCVNPTPPRTYETNRRSFCVEPTGDLRPHLMTCAARWACPSFEVVIRVRGRIGACTCPNEKQRSMCN